jgi:hypothetical protein
LVAAEQGLGKSAGDVRKAASVLLLGTAARDRAGGGTDQTPEAARKALAAVLASPETQIG